MSYQYFQHFSDIFFRNKHDNFFPPVAPSSLAPATEGGGAVDGRLPSHRWRVQEDTGAGVSYGGAHDDGEVQRDSLVGQPQRGGIRMGAGTARRRWGRLARV